MCQIRLSKLFEGPVPSETVPTPFGCMLERAITRFVAKGMCWLLLEDLASILLKLQFLDSGELAWGKMASKEVLRF